MSNYKLIRFRKLKSSCKHLEYFGPQNGHCTFYDYPQGCSAKLCPIWQLLLSSHTKEEKLKSPNKTKAETKPCEKSEQEDSKNSPQAVQHSSDEICQEIVDGVLEYLNDVSSFFDTVDNDHLKEKLKSIIAGKLHTC